MRFERSEAPTDVEQQFQGPAHSGAPNGQAPFLDGSHLTQMAHCFAHPDASHSVFTGTAGCAAGGQLLDSFSSCNISPFTLRSTTADVPVAYDMADQSPFARLLRSALEEDRSLPPGRCSPPDAALPAAHVQRVILPRVQTLLSPAATPSTSSDTAATSPPPSADASAPSALSSSSPVQSQPDEDYPEHHQLNDIMHVIQQHASNPFAMKENAAALTEELRAMLRIASSSVPSLGPAPDVTTNPAQFICACLHRANLLFILADLLFLVHASVNPETGFGLANTPMSRAPSAACVAEAEGLVVESLALHDKAMESYKEYVDARGSSRSSSPRVGGLCQVPSLARASSGVSSSGASDWEPCCYNVAAAADLEPELRSSRFVQPRSKVMLRFALIQAALGKREQAVETLHEIASLDPWIPELELRPPEVAHAHRLSVEQAKSGLVWYYNSSHDSLKANRYWDDAMLWKMRRMSQEVNSQWEPADLLPHRSQTITHSTADVPAGHTTGFRAARAAAMLAAVGTGGSDEQRSRSAPLLRHAQHFRAPVPTRDPQAGKSPPEQHMLKLLRDAQEAGDKELTISILARAIEHGAASTGVASPTVLEPLIEHSYHIVSAANPTCATTTSTAVRLLLHALTLLRDPTSVGLAAPARSEAAARLRLRRRAVHALATALHQNNRVSEPLVLHRRALAHTLHHCGDPESVSTVESRVHIAALSIVRLYMLSDSGANDLALVADRPDCCEGSWKTLYGRGRPGQHNRFFQPVVQRDNSVEVSNTARWLHQQLQMGIRILTLHLLRLARAAAERLQNLPEPSLASSHFPPRLTSPLPSRTPSSANLPLIHEAVGETESAHSEWGGDTDDLGVMGSTSTDMATGAATEDIVSDSEVPSAPASNHGIFRNVSTKSRLLKVGIGRSVASLAVLAAVEEDSKNWSVEDLVLLLENTCEEADALARDAQSQRGFALSQPPWVAHLCMPHWKIVLTLLSSQLTLTTPSTPPPGPTLEQLTETLSRVLSICTEYFSTAGAFHDGDSDTICSLNLSTSHQNTVTSMSPLGAIPMRPVPTDAGAVVSASAGQSSAASSPTAAAPGPPRSSLAAFSSAVGGTSSTVLSQAGAFNTAGPAEAPLNVYMPPDNLQSSSVRPASPLKQASAVAATVGTSTATEVAPASGHLQEALCLQVSCSACASASTSTCTAGSASSASAVPLGDAGSCGSSTSAAGLGCCSACDDACMSAFDFYDSPQVEPPLQSDLRRMFAHMYEIVDRGLGDDASDPEDNVTCSTSPAAVLHLYPKIVSNLPPPKPAHHVQHGQSAGYSSPTSTGITSPTPQSSLRLTYRSGSLSVSLPVAEVQMMIPKPTVESFGLEPDEATSISLGATPIPCMLAVCVGPDGVSSNATASPVARGTDAAAGQAAAQDPFGATSDAHPSSAATPLDTNEECSSADTRDVAQPVQSSAALPDAVATAQADSSSGAGTAASPPGSPHSLTAPQSLSHTQSAPVAIPPQSAEAHQHHACPFYPSTYPQGTVPSYEGSAGSVPVVPFAPCSHIFGAGGTSLCTAALSDPTCAAASRSPPQSHEQRESDSEANIATRDMHASHECLAPPTEALGSKHNAFGSDEFNADAFNAVPSELRHTFCRSPLEHAVPSVSAPALVSAYSCWHTPHIEHDCESFGDSGSPSSATDVDESAFGSACEPATATKASGDAAIGPSPLGPPNGTSNQHHFAPLVRNNENADDDSDDDVIGGPGTSLESEAPVVPVATVPASAPRCLPPVLRSAALAGPPTSAAAPSLPKRRSNEGEQLRTLTPPAATDMSSGAASMPSLPTFGSRSSLPCGQESSESDSREAAAALPPRVPSPGMPFGGTAAADCFVPPPEPAAHTFARPWSAQGGGPLHKGGTQERVLGGLARSRSPPGTFRPPRPPSPCVHTCSHKIVSQSNPGFVSGSEGECGAMLSRSGGEGTIEPAVFARPTPAGSSAPLLRSTESQVGGAFGGLLWGRDGPGSAGGHMRARSVCLDNLDL